MAQRLTRRDMLKRSGALAAAAGAASLFPAPAVLADASPHTKLNMVLIGCGGRGRSHLPDMTRHNLVALVDPDDGCLTQGIQSACENSLKHKKDFRPSQIKTFSDYRTMYDKFHKQIDAVVIATPDHQHACPSMMAIQLGKHVYCEKPLVHHISEARALGTAARKAKVVTQMGNQGSGTGNHQVLAEYLEAGAIGKLIEVHGWHGFESRFGGSMPKPEPQPAPKVLDWDDWVGPATLRPFNSVYRPWHGWCDFGTGSLGGWATHVMDAVYFALKLGCPDSVELVEVDDPSQDRFPRMTKIRFDFPARGPLAPISVFWYDGSKPNKDPNLKGKTGRKLKSVANVPSLVAQIEKEHGRKLGNAGSIFVGEKGMICCGSHGAAPIVLPDSRSKQFIPPPKKLPRPTGGIMADFLSACLAGGGSTFSGFGTFSGPFLEMLLTGHLAVRAGLNRRVAWDGANMKCTNLPELNRYVDPPYRKGWSL